MKKLTQSLVVLLLCCGGGKGGYDASIPADAPEVHDAPPQWTSDFVPGVEKRGAILVLRLKGTPYEMGVQHATFLHDQLIEGCKYIDNSYLGLLEPMAKENGYIDEAIAQSYPRVVEECRGMSDTLPQWTFDRCMALAWGDVILENIKNGACTQFVATRAATPSGEMVHGRNLDWDKIDFMLDYPTVIVRHPTGLIPYAVVGYPGNVAPYNGINAAGISIASNDANSKNDIDRKGRSHVQMVGEILATATSLGEATAFLKAQDHTTAEIVVVADGEHDTAAVFEMSASHLAVREMGQDGVVYATNHFIEPETKPFHIEYGPDASSMTRFVRLLELVPPGGAQTLYGKFDKLAAAKVLRDNHNPLTGKVVPADQFDGGGTIGNNGCIYSLVFIPKKREFHVAGGNIPVPMNAYEGFSLHELLGEPGAVSPVGIPAAE